MVNYLFFSAFTVVFECYASECERKGTKCQFQVLFTITKSNIYYPFYVVKERRDHWRIAWNVVRPYFVRESSIVNIKENTGNIPTTQNNVSKLESGRMNSVRSAAPTPATV